MNSNPRQLKLLDVVRTRGSVTVEQLADLLAVTLQTVRRDVQRLSEAGLLARFHGGMRRPSSTIENLAYRQRESLNAAATLSSNANCEVIVTGGVVRPRDRGIVDEAAVAFLRQFRVDIALIGISGIEADGSLRDFDYREVKVAQTIISHAREVWLSADSSKFNRPAMVELATLSQINRLFTDQPPPEPCPALLADAGVRCDIAPH